MVREEKHSEKELFTCDSEYQELNKNYKAKNEELKK